jgi:hypothetical protein
LSESVTISAQLTQLLDELANAVSTTAEVLQKIKNQAESDGLTKEQTREVIITTLSKRQLSRSQIYRYLPAELKNPVKQKAVQIREENKHTKNSDVIMTSEKADKVGETEEENSYLEQANASLKEQVKELSEALEKAGQPQTADRLQTTEVIIEPRLYATLFAALRHQPKAIRLEIQGNRATGIIEAEIL